MLKSVLLYAYYSRHSAVNKHTVDVEHVDKIKTKKKRLALCTNHPASYGLRLKTEHRHVLKISSSWMPALALKASALQASS